MKKFAFASALVTSIAACQIQAQCATLHVEVKNIKNASFVEFKAESNQKGEHATGHLKNNESCTKDWDMGGTNQNIWVWWDTIQGDASLKLSVDGTVIFDSECHGTKKGETRITNSAVQPVRVYQSKGSPRLEDAPGHNYSYIRW